MSTLEGNYKDGFERRKEHSKEVIRKAAIELFRQFGVERVSIVDIAKKAGVSQATIYNNFESKNTLAREFVKFMVGHLVSSAETALASQKTFEEKIKAFVSFISGSIGQSHLHNENSLILHSSIDLRSDPEITRILETTKAKMMGLILQTIHEGQEQGVVNSDISEKALTIYFNAFMDIFIDPNLQTDLFTNPRLVKDLTNLLFNGLI